ncbi:MAG: hypothetical protein M1837_005917 [Sclerophora amabilis]|nr:MAG: hypothetical protein M1837_005917 [Sclerophora amabilis]
MSLAEKLDKIRVQQPTNQEQTGVILRAVEDTLREQQSSFTPTAYFAALLALLSQSSSSSNGAVNKDLATSVTYLLDLVTPYTPTPLLRSKFPHILTHLAPVLTHPEAESRLLRSSLGCLESLLVAQDAAAWALPPTQIGPRRAVAGLLDLAKDQRPKVRKRAQDCISTVLKSPPPSPSLDHPAADMCAEASLRRLDEVMSASGKNKKHRGHAQDQHDPNTMHALKLVKLVAAASGGWPSKKIEHLCEILLRISKSSNEYLTMTAFEIFEVMFEGMADEVSSAKLPRLMEVISELRPSQNDAQLLPPWIAVLSRAYDVSAQVDAEETFQRLPEAFNLVSGFLTSASHNIRVSASECLISFMTNCVPGSVIIEPSIYDEKVFEKLTSASTNLLSVRYQSAWMEVFRVLGAMFDSFKWRSDPLLSDVVKTVGELRSNDSFSGKKEADEVLGKAIGAMGPESVLQLLPLNLAQSRPGNPGRAWLLPILRNFVGNTHLAHFRSEFVPLSETIFQRTLESGGAEKTMELKIFETLVQQIWALLPGYCDLPLDLTQAFDQTFAEMISNILYKQVDLRADICRALQNLVDSNNAILALEGTEDDLILQNRVSKAAALTNISHLAGFAGNLLAVLFNVYSQTLPQYRGFILRCINAYLSITLDQELMSTFTKVTTMLEASLQESGLQTQAEKQKQKKTEDKMPPMSHTYMDLIITISIYLPRESFATLFNMASLIIVRDDDPQLQKKAYKLIPRLAESELGKAALQERNIELQSLLLSSAEKASAPAKRDRLTAISQVVEYLPSSDLHFIPSILSEVVISAKEVNDKARTAAFDLLVLMGKKMQQGGTVVNSKVAHMPDDAPDVPASLEEYFTMVSAGLAGSTPHMIKFLPEALLADLVSTLDLFLTSNNREIVRSVLGFLKVCVISLPISLMQPRLQSLIPNLMIWSHEHKAHFKAKVKHILERMIRRFGVEVVEKWCPEEDRKLIANVRKTRERRKRKKDAGEADGDDNNDDEEKQRQHAQPQQQQAARQKGRFESEFDQVAYGSDDSNESGASSDSDDDEDDEEAFVAGIMKRSKRAGKAGNQIFITEDDDEPLDLLDKRSLGNISSTRPLKPRTSSSTATDRARKSKSKAKTDADGKLLFGGDGEDGEDSMMIDFEGRGNRPTNGAGADADGIGGIDAYVDAVSGKDAVQRGQRGRLKYSNRRDKRGGSGDRDMDVDVDDNNGKADEAGAVVGAAQRRGGGQPVNGHRPRGGGIEIARGGRGGRGRGERRRGGGGGGGGGIAETKNQRKGLGVGKTPGGSGGSSGGRIMKSPRGKTGRRRF